jgi:hypothetical protein
MIVIVQENSAKCSSEVESGTPHVIVRIDLFTKPVSFMLATHEMNFREMI